MEIFPFVQNMSTGQNSNALENTTRKDTESGISPPLEKKQMRKKKENVTYWETATVLPEINCDEEKQVIHEKDVKTKIQPRDKKNHYYKMQCELAFERIAQNISRSKYSYFKRIPSPPPLRRKEKIYKAYQESVKKKSCNKTEFLCVRTSEEYDKMRAELEEMQEQFVKRHNIRK